MELPPLPKSPLLWPSLQRRIIILRETGKKLNKRFGLVGFFALFQHGPSSYRLFQVNRRTGPSERGGGCLTSMRRWAQSRSNVLSSGGSFMTPGKSRNRRIRVMGKMRKKTRSNLPCPVEEFLLNAAKISSCTRNTKTQSFLGGPFSTKTCLIHTGPGKKKQD